MHKVRLEKARKKFSSRIKRKLGKVEGYEQVIEGMQRDFDISTQNAEQVVALEPQMPELPESWSDSKKEAEEKAFVERLGGYIDNQETNAYGEVLGRLASLRNAILKAETFGFGEGKPSVAGMESTSEKKVYEVATEIANINAYTERVAADIAAYKAAHPKAKGLPAAIKKEIKERDKKREKLPFLRTQEQELRQLVGELREKFYPGDPDHVRIAPPSLPLEGSGTLEEMLIGVQGTHWPDLHELLPASSLRPPRVVGRFGGDIWDVQTSIEELGLKKAQAAGSGGGGGGDTSEGEHEALLKELLTQSNQERLIRDIERRVLGDRDELVQRFRLGGLVDLPPYAGKAHTGAIVPGPRTQERTMIVRGNEGIFTEDQRDWLMQAPATGSSAGAPNVHVTVYEGGEVEVEIDEKKVEAIIDRKQQREARKAGTRRGGGRRF
jgi:outer membrane murein-binding lipoprotein Lpp